MKSEGSGVDGGCDASVFLSTLTFVLPGVLALTRRSLVDVGLGLVIIGQKGVSLSSKICQMVLVDCQMVSNGENGDVG